MTDHLVVASPHEEMTAPLPPAGVLPGIGRALHPSWAPPAPDLVAVVESRAPLAVRLAAGALLALAGDPRVPVEPVTVPVPGGRALVGLDPADVDAVVARWAHVGVLRSWIEKETPVHEVAVAPFAIGRYPVTNGQWLAFLLDAGHPTRPSTWYLGAFPWDRSNHPVCGLSTGDVDAYLAWLRRTTGRPYRLPTEAEWEYAASGGSAREFPWGDEWVDGLANTRELGVGTTTPVGAFPAGASPFGLLDMAGNVEEYVADEYGPYPGGPAVVDDLVEEVGAYRVTRGGSFSRYGDLARTRRRHGPFPSPLYPIGFRVAVDL